MASGGKKASKAAKSEATKQKHVYTFKGEAFSFSSELRDDPNLVDALEAYESGKLVLFVKGLMGEAQWLRYKAKRPTIVDLNDFSDWFATSYGFKDAGESQASSGS